MPPDDPQPISFAGVGVTLRADRWGDPSDPPVVLLHGGGQTRRAWSETASVLAGRGWCAYAVDLRGHGDSDWAPDGEYDIDRFVGDIVAICRSLDELPVLVGASLGGTSALVAIGEAADPIARALVLVDVAPRTVPEGAQRIMDFMLARVDDGFASLDEMADAVAAYNPARPRPSDGSGLRHNVREREGRWFWHWDPSFMRNQPADPREGLAPPLRLHAAAASLRIPVLLVRGGSSDVVDEHSVDAFLEAVPHAVAATVAGAGHMVVGDRNDAFNGAISSFLDDVRQGRAPTSEGS